MQKQIRARSRPLNWLRLQCLPCFFLFWREKLEKAVSLVECLISRKNEPNLDLEGSVVKVTDFAAGLDATTVYQITNVGFDGGLNALRMRILLVHNILNDSRSVSGVLKHYLLMARSWIDSGVQTDFLAAKAGWPQIKDQVPKAGLISSDSLFDATNYLSKTWRYFPAYGLRTLSAYWTRLPHRYDVVYATSQPIFEVFPSRALARRSGAKLVVKYHHLLSAQPKRVSFFDRLFLKSEEMTMRWLNREADLIICSTPPVLRDFHSLEARLGLPRRDDAVLIGYGLDIEHLTNQPPQPKIYDAVFLGRIHEHKGAFDLPHVWAGVLKSHPSAKLLVIGEGPRREIIQKMFADLGISHTVRFTGGIPEAEKNALLAQAKIGLSLSYEEGWGLSVTECMAFGMPVIAYGLPIFRDVFAKNLIEVPVGDREAFTLALSKLMTDPVRQADLGQRNQQFVQRYDYREIARQELDAIKSILK